MFGHDFMSSYIISYHLLGHAFDVNTLAYSPDGQLIATGGNDGKIKLWNTSTGFCFITFSEHTGPINVVEFSNSGTVVFSAR